MDDLQLCRDSFNCCRSAPRPAAKLACRVGKVGTVVSQVAPHRFCMGAARAKTSA